MSSRAAGQGGRERGHPDALDQVVTAGSFPPDAAAAGASGGAVADGDSPPASVGAGAGAGATVTRHSSSSRQSQTPPNAVLHSAMSLPGSAPDAESGAAARTLTPKIDLTPATSAPINGSTLGSAPAPSSQRSRQSTTRSSSSEPRRWTPISAEPFGHGQAPQKASADAQSGASEAKHEHTAGAGGGVCPSSHPPPQQTAPTTTTAPPPDGKQGSMQGSMLHRWGSSRRNGSSAPRCDTSAQQAQSTTRPMYAFSSATAKSNRSSVHHDQGVCDDCEDTESHAFLPGAHMSNRARARCKVKLCCRRARKTAGVYWPVCLILSIGLLCTIAAGVIIMLVRKQGIEGDYKEAFDVRYNSMLSMTAAAASAAAAISVDGSHHDGKICAGPCQFLVSKNTAPSSSLRPGLLAAMWLPAFGPERVHEALVASAMAGFNVTEFPMLSNCDNTMLGAAPMSPTATPAPPDTTEYVVPVAFQEPTSPEAAYFSSQLMATNWLQCGTLGEAIRAANATHSTVGAVVPWRSPLSGTLAVAVFSPAFFTGGAFAGVGVVIVDVSMLFRLTVVHSRLEMRVEIHGASTSGAGVTMCPILQTPDYEEDGFEFPMSFDPVASGSAEVHVPQFNPLATPLDYNFPKGVGTWVVMHAHLGEPYVDNLPEVRLAAGIVLLLSTSVATVVLSFTAYDRTRRREKALRMAEEDVRARTLTTTVDTVSHVHHRRPAKPCDPDFMSAATNQASHGASVSPSAAMLRLQRQPSSPSESTATFDLSSGVGYVLRLLWESMPLLQGAVRDKIDQAIEVLSHADNLYTLHQQQQLDVLADGAHREWLDHGALVPRPVTSGALHGGRSPHAVKEGHNKAAVDFHEWLASAPAARHGLRAANVGVQAPSMTSALVSSSSAMSSTPAPTYARTLTSRTTPSSPVPASSSASHAAAVALAVALAASAPPHYDRRRQSPRRRSRLRFGSLQHPSRHASSDSDGTSHTDVDAGGVESRTTRGAGTGAGAHGALAPHALPKPPPDALAMLRDMSNFDLDMLELARVLPQPLVAIGTAVFDDRRLLDVLGLSRSHMRQYLAHIGDGYVNSNPYHTATHAANVVWNLQHFLQGCVVPLEPLDVFSAIIAAAVHDYKHPGFTNSFLTNTFHPLSIQYNDVSPLENMHVAEAFTTALSMLQANPFEPLSTADFRAMRSMVIKLVLATDMSTHFAFIAKLSTAQYQRNCTSSDAAAMEARKAVALTGAVMLADIGHAAAAFPIHSKWSQLIRAEFFRQGDVERQRGLTISPLCDRTKARPLAESQIGFFDLAALPLYKTLHGTPNLLTLQPYISRLHANRAQWKAQVHRHRRVTHHRTGTGFQGAASDLASHRSVTPSTTVSLNRDRSISTSTSDGCATASRPSAMV